MYKYFLKEGNKGNKGNTKGNIIKFFIYLYLYYIVTLLPFYFIVSNRSRKIVSYQKLKKSEKKR